jgi:hypothetical protein
LSLVVRKPGRGDVVNYDQAATAGVNDAALAVERIECQPRHGLAKILAREETAFGRFEKMDEGWAGGRGEEKDICMPHSAPTCFHSGAFVAVFHMMSIDGSYSTRRLPRTEVVDWSVGTAEMPRGMNERKIEDTRVANGEGCL